MPVRNRDSSGELMKLPKLAGRPRSYVLDKFNSRS